MTNQTPGAEAHATLHQNVYLPVFFQKLAEYPEVPVPQTEADFAKLLRISGRLRQDHDTRIVKQAAAYNPFDQAEQLLDSLLTKTASSQDIDQLIQADARQIVASNPALAKAAIDWQNNVAQELLNSQQA